MRNQEILNWSRSTRNRLYFFHISHYFIRDTANELLDPLTPFAVGKWWMMAGWLALNDGDCFRIEWDLSHNVRQTCTSILINLHFRPDFSLFPALPIHLKNFTIQNSKIPGGPTKKFRMNLLIESVLVGQQVSCACYEAEFLTFIFVN